MNDGEKLTTNLRLINQEVPEFRMIEELTMLLATESYSTTLLRDSVTSPSGMQRLGYLSDVANEITSEEYKLVNPSLYFLNLLTKNWALKNLAKMGSAYFTPNHDISDTVRSKESLKWNVISSFSVKDIENKFKLKYQQDK